MVRCAAAARFGVCLLALGLVAWSLGLISRITFKKKQGADGKRPRNLTQNPNPKP